MPCLDCDEWWCRLHEAHVHDCECPDLESLLDHGVDPYLTPYEKGPPPEEEAGHGNGWV